MLIISNDNALIISIIFAADEILSMLCITMKVRIIKTDKKGTADKKMDSVIEIVASSLLDKKYEI